MFEIKKSPLRVNVVFYFFNEKKQAEKTYLLNLSTERERQPVIPVRLSRLSGNNELFIMGFVYENPCFIGGLLNLVAFLEIVARAE